MVRERGFFGGRERERKSWFVDQSEVVKIGRERGRESQERMREGRVREADGPRTSSNGVAGSHLASHVSLR